MGGRSTGPLLGRGELLRLYPDQVTVDSAQEHDLDLDLGAAIDRLGRRVHTTPLLHSHLLDQRVGARVWLKAENFQRAGSFKSRGAFNAVLVGLEKGDSRGVAALSSGNHGQAVALATSELGLSSVVVMSETSSKVKISAVRGYGAEVISRGVHLGNREQIARALAAERDLRLIHPHDDPDVISGQATVGFELASQLRAQGVESPLVLVPVGGGGLISGVVLAMRRWLPGAQVVGVEPEASNDGQLSLASGTRVELEVAPVTVADGAATARLGRLCWEIISKEVDEILTVSDPQIGAACWWLWSRCKLVVEPTGALSVAAALWSLGGRVDRAGANQSTRPTEIVCILSGGNCEPNQIAELVRSAREAELVAAPGPRTGLGLPGSD